MMVIAAVLLMVLSPFHDLLVRDLLAIVLFLVIIPVSIILALILLRLSTYFRDNYRATNYGVPDLVELIRQLDLAVVQMRQSKGRPTNEPRIKLSFIGHSMGCFVVTNTIRILSDVFDPPSINKTPTAEIGNVFCLERLILVAPDIPVETVIPLGTMALSTGQWRTSPLTSGRMMPKTSPTSTWKFALAIASAKH
ncbi:MAG: hypothetical protein LDL41_00495 [Coleofasciculus sp. S288]|nr:hypothetical protein [Coleofasciculus sp. S288]